MSDADMIETQLANIRITAIKAVDEIHESQWEQMRLRVNELERFLASIRWLLVMHDAEVHDKLVAEQRQSQPIPIRKVPTPIPLGENID